MGNKSYSKGISWIDDCRIPFVDEGDKKQSVPGGKVSYTNESWGQQAGLEKDLQPKREPNTDGRFPANLLVSDDMLNDGKIGQNNSKNQEWGFNDDFKVNEYLVGLKKSGISRIADKGTNSRYYDIDKWFDNILNG
jgi:hypothetical protein